MSGDNDPPDPARALRRLFLTLFLRGRSARGQTRRGAPVSVGRKLGLVLAVYALIGLFALGFVKASVFALALGMHATTFLFIVMFVANSAGEVLFNRDEADILLHRPVTPSALLWAKTRVLVEVALWLAGALNLVSLFVGPAIADGGWLYPLAHPLSLVLEALFCVASVVVTYQLCLRWFGRERLDGLMTTVQVAVTVGAMLAGQVAPRLIGRMHGLTPDPHTWWLWLLPPVWFAAIDDVLTGHLTAAAGAAAATAVAATLVAAFLALSTLAGDYGHGLQRLNEATPASRGEAARRRWIDRLVARPPLRWWLRDPVTRASFLLTVGYLLRDRDVKLRVYPGLAPMLVIPTMLLIQGGARHGDSGFGVAFASGYIGLIPLIGQEQLRYSAQWQAADVFRCAPLDGPAAICHGARRAVLCVLVAPCLTAFAAIALIADPTGGDLPMLLPGLLAMPVYALVPNLGGRSLPLSVASESANGTRGALVMTAVSVVALALSGLGMWARAGGWFWWMIGVEAATVAVVATAMRRAIDRVRWSPLG